MCDSGKMSTVYCTWEMKSQNNIYSMIVHLFFFFKKRKKEILTFYTVCLYLENTWKETHKIVYRVSLESRFKREER